MRRKTCRSSGVFEIQSESCVRNESKVRNTKGGGFHEWTNWFDVTETSRAHNPYVFFKTKDFRCCLLFLPALSISTRKNVGHFVPAAPKIQGHVSASSAHPSLGIVAQGRENSWGMYSITCALPVVR